MVSDREANALLSKIIRDMSAILAARRAKGKDVSNAETPKPSRGTDHG